VSTQPLRTGFFILLVIPFALLVLLALCSPLQAENEAGGPEVPVPKLFILSFNRWGDLSNPAERDLAMRELAADGAIERIIIFSYGWANDGESSYATYYDLVNALTVHRHKETRTPKTAVIAVGWDSTQSGFRKLFNDVLPFPALSSVLSTIPDLTLFPLSFWSKAATADRIGFGGLRTALNEIFGHAYPDGKGTPDIFLVGHSFGTRIVSELMQDKFAVFPVRAEPFVARDRVRGAVLLQPAIAQAGLHRNADYPILITQSQHDHAVGGLFPIANLLINTSTFTSFEALFRYQFFDPFNRSVGQAAQTVAEATHVIPGEKPQETDRGTGSITGSLARSAAKITSRTWYLALRTVGEFASLPVALASGAITTPFNYAYIQARALTTHPFDHIMDSFAQIPVVEILVAGASKAAGREIPWGRRGKGLFNLGALNESVGRLRTHAMANDIASEVYSLADFESARENAECGLPRCKGVLLLDATDFIEVGIFGLSLNRPGVDFTLGWLDPLGSHTDYKNATVVRLIADFFDAASADRHPDS
jgi:pimeloyl-ACP methyl ester carboxylesterase